MNATTSKHVGTLIAFCSYILPTGKRKGERCGHTTYDAVYAGQRIEDNRRCVHHRPRNPERKRKR